MSENLEKIAKSAGIMAVGMIIGGFFNYLSRVVVARWLGSSVYGLLSLAISLTSMITILSLLGLSQGLARYIPHFKAKNNLSKVKGTIFSSIKISFPLSLILAFSVFYFSSDIANLLFNKPSLAPVLQIFAFIIPANVLLNLFTSCLRGFKKTKYKIFTIDVLLPGIRIGLILLFISLSLDILGVSLAYVIASIITSLLVFYILENKVFSFFENNLEIDSNTRQLIEFSWPMMLTGLLTIALNQIDILILGVYRASSQVGIYNVALPTSMLIVWILGAFNFLFRPIISELNSKSDLKEIKHIYSHVSRWVFIAGLPLLLMMLLFSDKILNILFGSEYVTGGLPLSILAIGYFFYSFTGTSSSILVSIGKTKKILLVSLITVILNIALNLYLIPAYGMVGASISLSASFIVSSALSVLLVYNEINFHFLSLSFLKSGLPAFIFVPLFWFFRGYIVSKTSIFLIFGIIFLLSYFVVIRFLNILTDQDLKIIKSLISDKL